MHDPWITLGYLVSAVMFILGIKRLGSPATARQGNQIAAVGMLIAIIVTVIDLRGTDLQSLALLAVPAMVIGGAVGGIGARRVQMTGMPQMVALFNGLGAGAAALIAAGDYRHLSETGSNVALINAVPILLSCLIGSVSFSGSLVAFAKLQELMPTRPLTYSGQKLVNAVVLLGIIVAGVTLAVEGHGLPLLAAYGLAALLLGVLFVLPIGGADMPVIISLLNSFTGLAAAVTGFVLKNEVLIVSGALVGASGTILTQLMSKAMNRPLSNVLFGAFGSAGGAPAAVREGRQARAATVEDVAVLLAYARRVVIVPGYGLAVARGQHAVKELANELEAHGVEVEYAIHPVAGRMPGHMNVLLAEAKVPYPQLKEMDEVNPDFPRTDVALVIGANDVVNPAARNDPGSPIYGMPILNVDQAQSIVVMKRSMNTGFAGIDNPLFYDPKTVMLFGDAAKMVTALSAEVKRVLGAA